jgi:hypothetical protein
LLDDRQFEEDWNAGKSGYPKVTLV